FKINITDIQNGFRAIRKDVFMDINLKSNGFTIEQEMVIKVLKKGYRVVEVSSHEFRRKYGRSRVNVYKQCFGYLWNLFFNLIV
ncbi:MAG: hypothetical protein ACTSQP_24615, partial [Promethearchaeota archaeon]